MVEGIVQHFKRRQSEIFLFLVCVIFARGYIGLYTKNDIE